MAADLQVIMIVCNRGLEDREPLDSVALCLDGLKVESMLYTCAMGNANNGSDDSYDEDELMHELPDDSYDEEDIDLEVEECYNGKDIVAAFADFVNENYTDNTMVIAYDMNDEMYNELRFKLGEISNNYEPMRFEDIFKFMKTNNISIKELLSRYGIRENMLLPDSEISLAYFLSVLINQIYDK